MIVKSEIAFDCLPNCLANANKAISITVESVKINGNSCQIANIYYTISYEIVYNILKVA